MSDPSLNEQTYVDEVGHLVVRIGSSWIGIAVQHVAELTEPLPLTRIPRTPPHIPGVFAFRGYAIPLLDITDFLNIRKGTEALSDDEFAHPRFVILEHEGSRVGVRCAQTRNVSFLTGARFVEHNVISNPRLRDIVHTAIELDGLGVILLVDVARLLETSKVQ